MNTIPHDVVDLYLAPVALHVDGRLEELGLLDVAELETRVAIEANASLRNRESRADALLMTIGYFIDTHGWQLSWHPRGLELRNGGYAVVLGVPAVFEKFLAAA